MPERRRPPPRRVERICGHLRQIDCGMYGLSETVDLSFLERKSLIQVCVGQDEVILELSEHVSVIIGCAIRLSSATGSHQLFEDSRQSGAALLDLIGKTVCRAEAIEPGTLCLAWAHGQILEVIDSWAGYESYTTTSRDHVVVV